MDDGEGSADDSLIGDLDSGEDLPLAPAGERILGSSGTEDIDEDVGIAFSYPVGDGTTYPAGGWAVLQVLGHYNPYWGGRHLAQDLIHPDGGIATIDQSIYSIGDGVVRYAGVNGSTYRHVILIEHALDDGTSVCSFFGHLNEPLVETGETVERGQEIGSIMNWAEAAEGGSSGNTHLHYTVLSKALCDASAAAGGALVCGYDDGLDMGIYEIGDEPERYTSVGDPCYTQQYEDAFLSPTQFIENHHFAVEN